MYKLKEKWTLLLPTQLQYLVQEYNKKYISSLKEFMASILLKNLNIKNNINLQAVQSEYLFI
jgi:hypothetical protein